MAGTEPGPAGRKRDKVRWWAPAGLGDRPGQASAITAGAPEPGRRASTPVLLPDEIRHRKLPGSLMKSDNPVQDSRQ